MKAYLASSHDFQKVYRQGKRYDGVLMTAFVLPNNLAHNRFGITTSRKALGNAVKRNRAKRLLKETFRLRRPSVNCLAQRYDWVINAKGRLPSLRVTAAIEEFDQLVSRVARAERKGRE